jgi:hypothetical protein
MSDKAAQLCQYLDRIQDPIDLERALQVMHQLFERSPSQFEFAAHTIAVRLAPRGSLLALGSHVRVIGCRREPTQWFRRD